MKKSFVLSVALFAACTLSSAQEFSTTYFLDNNLYSYRINPAIPGEKNFASIVIGNVNLSFGSNIGLSSLLYVKPGGGLMTGLNSAVSTETFLNNLNNNNRLDQVFNENIIATGFWTKNAFHNIEINLKEDIFVGLPKDLFAMMKVGSSALPYDLSQTNASIKSYAEIAYGYTRRINEKFSVGGRVKFLVGLASGQVGFEKGLVSINGSQVAYDMQAKFRLSSNFLSIGTKADNASIFDFSALKLAPSSLTPCGYGGAVDLGMTYRPIKGLELSLSVVDLGGIAWKYNIVGVSSGSDSFTGETIKSDGTIKGDFEAFIENTSKLVDFKQVENGESAFEMIACTMNLGARYYMPFYERLSVGLLLTGKLDKYNSSFGGRLGVTVTPLDWLSLTGNYGVTTYCSTFGAAISLNAANLNFVFGYEGYSGQISNVKVPGILMPLATPIKSFQNMIKLGVNITFGARHNDFKPVGKSFIHGYKASAPAAGAVGAEASVSAAN